MVIKQKQNPLVYERTLGMSVMEGKGFYYPNDAAVSSNGKIYVLNRSLEARGRGRGMRVTICDTSDEFHGDFRDRRLFHPARPPFGPAAGGNRRTD